MPARKYGKKDTKFDGSRKDYEGNCCICNESKKTVFERIRKPGPFDLIDVSIGAIEYK